MAKEQSPAFQFYPKDWLSDGRVMAMSPAQRGCYIQLLATCWIEVRLPLDLPSLANIAGVSEITFTAEIWPALQPCFRETPKGFRHNRLDEERSKQRAHRAQRRAAATARWSASRSHKPRRAAAMRKGCSSSPSSSSSVDQDHDLRGRGRRDKNPGALRALVAAVVHEDPAADLVELTERVKERAAKAGLAYDYDGWQHFLECELARERAKRRTA